MPESVKSAHTDNNGDVYLLVEEKSDWWTIKSAEKIGNTNGHRLLAAGDKGYVVNRWTEFVAGSGYPAIARSGQMGRYSIR